MDLRTRINDAVAWRISFNRVHSHLNRAVASFTFDDFPKNAWTVGGPMLARHGAAATYYAAGGLCGVTRDGVSYYDEADLRALHAAGHEVGCHSYSHIPIPLFGLRDLRHDLERNRVFLSEVLGEVAFPNFAYPFGAASLCSKRLVSRSYATARGIRPGVNSGSIDLGQLRVVRLERDRWNAREVEECVETARRTNGWIVFVSHDVSDDPSPYGATPGMLEHALATVRSSGVEILTMRRAFERTVLG